MIARSLSLLAIFVLLAAVAVHAGRRAGGKGPLFDYVHSPDSVYGYVEMPEKTIHGLGYTGYFLNMTSQSWLTEKDSSAPVWWHYLLVIVPDKRSEEFKSNGVMYMTGLSNTDGTPSATESDVLLASILAVDTQTVCSVLFQVPNQPVQFYEEKPVPKKRYEDAVIAWTWKHFIENQTDPTWLLRFPMTKAGVRGMDTIQDFMKKKFDQHITKFVVSGASKRGWTTWTVGAVDDRVIAIAPLVLDELNFVKNIHHHYRAYGGWSFALQDYHELNITAQIDNVEVGKMMDLVDPYSYRNILTMPKLVISSGGDEFLMPDNIDYYWSGMKGEKHFRLMPNCEHSLAENIPGVLESIGGFVIGVQANSPRPKYDWSISANGTITLTTSEKPTSVKLWKAYTIDGNIRRDFRLVTAPKGKPQLHLVLWSASEVAPSAPGVYHAYVAPPKTGWVGFILEAEFNGFGGSHYKFSTAPSILPQTFPYEDCKGEGCLGKLV